MKVLHTSLEAYGPGTYIPMFDPPVLIGKHVPARFCKLLVAELVNAKAIKSGVFDVKTLEEKVDSYHRSSKALMVDRELYDDVAMLMATVVNMHAGRLLSRQAFLSEPLQFLKYDDVTHGHFLPHTDNAFWGADGKLLHTSPHRHLTAILYVNEDYEGGELLLNSVQNDDGSTLTLKPKAGELVIFPSDIRFTHEVKPVTKGIRYSVVGWYSLK